MLMKPASAHVAQRGGEKVRFLAIWALHLEITCRCLIFSFGERSAVVWPSQQFCCGVGSEIVMHQVNIVRYLSLQIDERLIWRMQTARLQKKLQYINYNLFHLKQHFSITYVEKTYTILSESVLCLEYYN